jgi:hypothetical protein
MKQINQALGNFRQGNNNGLIPKIANAVQGVCAKKPSHDEGVMPSAISFQFLEKRILYLSNEHLISQQTCRTDLSRYLRCYTAADGGRSDNWELSFHPPVL